jgi:hypothetical protein
MLLTVSLLLSTVSSFLSWPLLLSHGLSCFVQFICCSLQFLLSFHGLCCSLLTSHAFFSFSAAHYSFFFPFMTSAALSWPLMLLSVSCFSLQFLHSFRDLCCSLITSHASFNFSAVIYSFYFSLQGLCYSLITSHASFSSLLLFTVSFMASAVLLCSLPLLLSTVSFSFHGLCCLLSHSVTCFFQFLCCSLQFLLFFHGLCCCFTAFAALLLPFMILSWPLWLFSRPQLISLASHALFIASSALPFTAFLVYHSLCCISLPSTMYVFADKKFVKHFPLCFRYFNHIIRTKAQTFVS